MKNIANTTADYNNFESIFTIKIKTINNQDLNGI